MLNNIQMLFGKMLFCGLLLAGCFIIGLVLFYWLFSIIGEKFGWFEDERIANGTYDCDDER